MNWPRWPVRAELVRESDGEPKGKRSNSEQEQNGAGTYVDHPVGHLAHTEPGGFTQLCFLVFAGVRMVGMTM